MFASEYASRLARTAGMYNEDALSPQISSEERSTGVTRPLAAWLREWRRRRGMSQRALAIQAGVAQGVIANIETDKFNISQTTARLLAPAIGLDLLHLCRLAEIPLPEEWVCERLSEAVLRRAYVDERRSTLTIASRLNLSRMTVVKYLRKYGIPTRKRAEYRLRYEWCNVAPFSELQTDWHAYWLGFLAADGCVYTANGRNLVRLRLKGSDEDHVRNFAQGTGSNALVTKTRNGYAQVEYFDRNLVTALARWGIVPNKTLTISLPADMPPDLVPAFVRGYFDGDGSIYWRVRGGCRAVTCKFVSGSPFVIDGIQATLGRAGIATGRVSHGSGRAVVLPVLTAQANLRSFAQYLYSGASVWLARKRQVFAELAMLK
jgi:transcriptional regulator with XRE-family HTH domain